MYVESLVGEKVGVGNSDKGNEEESEGDVETKDDAHGVTFSDSEEERAHGVDDGFALVEPVATTEKTGRTNTTKK